MTEQVQGTLKVKTGFAEMMKGGVIMDVVNPEQAKIAEEAGAVAVMALERVPADIRRARRRGAHERPHHDQRAYVAAVHHPGHGEVPASGTSRRRGCCRALGVDFIDESEVLTPADDRVPP